MTPDYVPAGSASAGQGQILQKIVHGADVCRLAVYQSLGNYTDPVIGLRVMVQIFKVSDHGIGIISDQQIRNSGVTVAVRQFHANFSVCYESPGRIQFRQFPAPLRCNGVDLGFQSFVFPQLTGQGGAQGSIHTNVQHTADFRLSQLCAFQQFSEHVLLVFHIHHRK